MGYSHRAISLYHYGITVVQGLGAFILVGLTPADRPVVFLPFLAYQIFYAWWILGRAKALHLV